MIKAVVFDLDDTLYPEIEYVKSGFKAIEKATGNEDFYEKLYDLFCEDSKNVYQRAGLSDEECRQYIDIYRKHFPDISLERSVKELLCNLKDRGFKLGIITDGRPEGQRNKISALGLDLLMDHIIVTDELGGVEYRKPNPEAFKLMKEALNVKFDEMMYIGDNPTKDFYIGSIYPITTVRLMGGTQKMYSDQDYKDNVKEKLRIDILNELWGVLD